MATRQAKTKLIRSNLEFFLIGTRLKKLAVEALIPSEESAKGRMELSYKIGISKPDNGDSAMVHLMITGRGLANDKGEDDRVSFIIDAAIDGVYQLSRAPKEKELEGMESQLANPVIPLLSDMIETLLIKCGYNGVVLSKNFPNPRPDSEII